MFSSLSPNAALVLFLIIAGLLVGLRIRRVVRLGHRSRQPRPGAQMADLSKIDLRVPSKRNDPTNGG